MHTLFSFPNLSPIWWMVAIIVGFALGLAGLYYSLRTKHPFMSFIMTIVIDALVVLVLMHLFKRTAVYF